MRGGHDTVCGCFPTGRHYPGIAERIARVVVAVEGLAEEFAAAIAWVDQGFVVLDFETTGLDPAIDRILEIGLVCFDGRGVVERKNWLVNPLIPVPEEAKKVHGIADEELAQAPTFVELFPSLLDLLSARLPVAYNADFDRSFFHAEYARLSRQSHPPSPPPALRPNVDWIDPLVWVRELQDLEKSKKLADVCERMGIALETAHRAAADAEATGHVLLGLAKDMPRSYGELIRLQRRYAARQDADMLTWRGRRS
jgi:DNA polymerase-3 subunit epsilon